MSWTNKKLKQLNRERDEIKEVAEELYYTFMSYLTQRERDEFIQRYNHTPETTNTDIGKKLMIDIKQTIKDNWY
jgi:AraC-like DNA-binding protein